MNFNNIYHLFNTTFSDKCFIDKYLLNININLRNIIDINKLNNIIKSKTNSNFIYDTDYNLLFNNNKININEIIITDMKTANYGRKLWDFSLLFQYKYNTVELSSYKKFKNNTNTYDINYIRYMHYCLEKAFFNIHIFNIIINYYLIEKKLLLTKLNLKIDYISDFRNLFNSITNINDENIFKYLINLDSLNEFKLELISNNNNIKQVIFEISDNINKKYNYIISLNNNMFCGIYTIEK